MVNRTMSNDIKQVLEELKGIKKDLQLIKENMPDKDMFLTAGEESLLEESYEDEKKGTLISGKDLRKEIGI